MANPGRSQQMGRFKFNPAYSNNIDAGVNFGPYNTAAAFYAMMNGAAGGIYDPNRLDLMFQDANGQTLVTATGQPVGLVLDGRPNSNVFISHVATSDEMNIGTWVASAGGWSGTGPNSCVCDGTQIGTTTWTGAAIPLVAGQYVKYTFTVSNLSGGSIIFSGAAAAQSISANGTYTVYGTGGVAPSIQAGVGRAVIITGYSADYYVGNPIKQTSAAARPTLLQDTTTGYNYFLFDGVDDNLVSGNNTWGFGGPAAATCWTGVERDQDVADAVITQLGNSSVTNGTAGIKAPDGIAANFGFLLRGTITTAERTVASVAAPDSRVVSSVFDVTQVTTAAQISILINGVAPAVVDVAGPTTSGLSLTSAILRVGSSSGASFFAGRLYMLAWRAGASSVGDVRVGNIAIGKYMGITIP